MPTSTLRTRLAIAAVTVLATGGALVAAALPAGASTHAAIKTLHASTKVSNRPDSGVHGNDWAFDAFTRSATITDLGPAALANCPGATSCFHFSGSVSDSGTFTTIPGGDVPGNGGLNGGAVPLLDVKVTGKMAGGIHYSFYSDRNYVLASRVAKTENDLGSDPTGRHTTGLWLGQFFAAGATFYKGGAAVTYIANNNGGWVYDAAPGSDSACPHATSEWSDSAPSWGASASDGNIEAPDANNC